MRQDDPAHAPPAAWLARFSRRAPLAARPPAAMPLTAKVSLKASISEFLLVTRLRARNLLSRRAHAAAVGTTDAEQAAVMAHFARILGVTCKHWFPEDTFTSRGHRPRL